MQFTLATGKGRCGTIVERQSCEHVVMGYNHNDILDIFTFNYVVLPSGVSGSHHPNLGEENKNQPGDWAKIVWFELRSMCSWI